jgi:hypothetical protein
MLRCGHHASIPSIGSATTVTFTLNLSLGAGRTVAAAVTAEVPKPKLPPAVTAEVPKPKLPPARTLGITAYA